MRGTVFPCELNTLSEKAQTEFETFLEINTVSKADLYAGKLCAALDRQHPRDLFDVKLLLENEGITQTIRQAFVVYLAGHSRPMNELLNPNLNDLTHQFTNEFSGMTNLPITLDELIETRKLLIEIIRENLTNEEREFLLSVKKCDPQWELLPIEGIKELPSLKWKLLNLRKMAKSKHTEAVNKLEIILAE